MPDTHIHDAYASLCDSGAFGIPGPAARLPGFAFASGLSPEGMRTARLILDVKKHGGTWRQHMISPVEDAIAAARALETLRRRPEVESVALNLEARDGFGRFVRHCLYRASGHDAPIDRALLAGLTRQEWDIFVGSWVERAGEALDYPRGTEKEEEVDFSRFPYRALVGPSEMRTAALAISIPAAALVGFLGFKLNFFLKPAEAAYGPTKPPIELVERILPQRAPR